MAAVLNCRNSVGKSHWDFEFLPAMQIRTPSLSQLRISRLHPSTRVPVCRKESANFVEMRSSSEVAQEIQKCYELINRLGRGAVYLGSSRIDSDHPHYVQAFELGREIAKLLDCTTGAGHGLMDAATKGALEAGKPVGGLKIGREATQWIASSIHAYLPPETY